MDPKKKAKDVQFYVEVMEASYSLDAARRSGCAALSGQGTSSTRTGDTPLAARMLKLHAIHGRYDPDELEEEQRERQLRKRMNAEFQNFAKRE